MTVRELYRNVLVELNKVEASALYVEDFLYYANKGVNWYVNGRYAVYDTSQQLSDDLRALRVGPEKILFGKELEAAEEKKYQEEVREEILKTERLRIQIMMSDAKYARESKEAENKRTRCISACNDEKCRDKCNAEFSATMVALNQDYEARKGPVIIKPRQVVKKKGNLTQLKHDYRHLLNCIVKVEVLTPVFECEQGKGTVETYSAKRLTADRKAAILNNSFLEPRFYRPYYDIAGNHLTIHTGDADRSKFRVLETTVEYLKNPKELKLDVEMLTEPYDRSDEMEFPEYVCIEILNLIIMFIMEQGMDPRLSTATSINRSVVGGGSGNESAG